MDDIGNIEFTNLKADVSYVVWTRIIATNMVAKSDAFTLTIDLDTVGFVMKSADNDQIASEITGWVEGGLVVRVPIDIEYKWYGDYDYDQDTNGLLGIKICSSNSNYVDIDSADDMSDWYQKVRLNTIQFGSGYIEFIGVQNLGSGEIEFPFTIQAKYNGNVYAEKKYTAKFKITQDMINNKPSEKVDENAGE